MIELEALENWQERKDFERFLSYLTIGSIWKVDSDLFYAYFNPDDINRVSLQHVEKNSTLMIIGICKFSPRAGYNVIECLHSSGRICSVTINSFSVGDVLVKVI
jgi:hypothetical protein